MAVDSAGVMRNVIFGLAVATVLAFTLVVPRVTGIDTWKIALALVGFGLLVASGRGKPR